MRIDGTEYVYFTDPNTGYTYGFNVTFFLSNYQCTWGKTCCGVDFVPSHGCCADGVTLETRQEYVHTIKMVERAAKLGVWANYEALKDTLTDYFTVYEDDEESHGHMDAYNGACIMHNEGGEYHGCALHQASLKLGEDPRDGKPFACWAYPLHYESWDGDSNIYVIGPVSRTDAVMNHQGGGWWCIDDQANYNGRARAFHTMSQDLIRMSSPEVYAMFFDYCAERVRTGLPKDYGNPANARRDGRYPTVPVTLTRKR